MMSYLLITNCQNYTIPPPSYSKRFATPRIDRATARYHAVYPESKMPNEFHQFNQYKLQTKFEESYCEHTVDPGDDAEPTGDDPPQHRTERWSRERIIGGGGFGTVWLEREVAGALRAVKQISKGSKNTGTGELLALTKLGEVNTFFF